MIELLEMPPVKTYRGPFFRFVCGQGRDRWGMNEREGLNFLVVGDKSGGHQLEGGIFEILCVRYSPCAPIVGNPASPDLHPSPDLNLFYPLPAPNKDHSE